MKWRGTKLSKLSLVPLSKPFLGIGRVELQHIESAVNMPWQNTRYCNQTVPILLKLHIFLVFKFRLYFTSLLIYCWNKINVVILSSTWKTHSVLVCWFPTSTCTCLISSSVLFGFIDTVMTCQTKSVVNLSGVLYL